MAANGAGCSRGKKKILVVGLACLDIINVVDSYPAEDTDMRVSSRKWCRGGNAANSAVVLSQLGPVVECFVTFSDQPTTQIIEQSLRQYGVQLDNCITCKGCETPTSIVIVNKSNGTRTILHGNHSLPELKFEDFDELDLSCYRWIHFEGRNVTEVLKMIAKIRTHNKDIPSEDKIVVSVEVEKVREENKLLFPAGDVVFVSKDYARHHGFTTGAECLEGNAPLIQQGAILICAWGEQGAWGRDPVGRIHSSPSFKPSQVLETLAAGDTFNAGVIFSLSSGKSLEESLTFGCRLAGYKCGIEGLDIGGFSLP